MARQAGRYRSRGPDPSRAAHASRFEEGSEWARAERRDRWKALVATVLVHAGLALGLGFSIPSLASRAEAAAADYREFEVSIPPADQLRRLLAPEPTRAATRLLPPSNSLSSRPIEGAPSFDLGPSSPERPPLVTTPQAGRFGSTGTLLDPGGDPSLLTLQIEDSRRDAPEVLRSSAELTRLIERRPSSASTPAGDLPGTGSLDLDGGTANTVTLYREEASITQRMIDFGLSGSCQIEMRVDASGRVVQTTVLTGSGSALLDAAAEEAAKRWRYDPKALERLGVNRCRYWFRALSLEGESGGR